MKVLFFVAIAFVVTSFKTTFSYKSNAIIAGKISYQNQQNNIEDTAGINGQWFLQPVLAADTATGKFPALRINLLAGTFSGNTGCNTMNGSFKKTDTSFVFNQNIATSKMNCIGYNEDAFIKSLLRTNSYKIEKGVLILMFDATELSRWTRKPDRRIKMKTT